MTKKDYLARGFNKVDEADDLSTYSSCLELLHSIEFFIEYKRESFTLLELEEDMSVLEAGSGLGDDALHMAELVSPGGNVVGVDSSAHMVKEARSKIEPGEENVQFLIGDITNLEFPENRFDRCRVDRTLQHIEHPEIALMEMERVLKPGGIILAFDNDWETFTVSSSMKEVIRKLANFWCGSFASGWIGRELYGHFTSLGLEDIRVIPKTLVVTELMSADRVFDIFNTISHTVENEIITKDEADELTKELYERDEKGTFFSSYTGFLVCGRKPG